MRNIIEKIREKNILLIIKILFIALIIGLLLFLNEWKPAQEAMVLAGGVGKEEAAAAANVENESEKETSEGQSESLTPAELAMLEGENAQSSVHGRGTRSGKAAAGSGSGMSVLLEKIWQMPADFRIPMAMLDGQGEETPTELWMVTSKEEDESQTEASGQEEEALAKPETKVSGKEEEALAKPETKVSGQKETSVEYQIVEHQEGLSFQQWQIVSEKYKIVRAGNVPPFDMLKKMVENRIDGYDGDWSVYVKDLNTGESVVVNDRPMKSASVMKLFILGTVYKAIEAGELERTDEVVSLMNSMITASDNEASNRLLYLLGNSNYEKGIAKVDAFIQEYGFSDMTVEYNGFNDSETVLDTMHSNQVSAKDCGKLLEDIYRRTWVNRAAANEIEQMMLNQQTRYKIPAGLPDGVSCGNKTGEMDTTENDAAIIYGENCDYILVVLSSDWSSKDQAISRIASMSEMVYEFLN